MVSWWGTYSYLNNELIKIGDIEIMTGAYGSSVYFLSRVRYKYIGNNTYTGRRSGLRSNPTPIYVPVIFTSEKLDKSYELVDAVNNLTINDAKYYESNTATASDTQCNLTQNLETVTRTSKGNEKFTHTNNRNFEQK